jgi:hypothetical protein
VPDDYPYVRALRDIRLRLGAMATDRQLVRWVEALRGYFHHQLWETANSVSGTTPSLDDYAQLRLANGAMPCSIALLDVAAGDELAQDVLDRPDIRALVEMTSLLVGWDNDIFSVSKELQRSDNGHNLMTVLARGANPLDSLPLAVLYRDAVMRRFLFVRATALSTADETTTRFLENLGNWVHANIVFSLSTSRYRTIAPIVAGCAHDKPAAEPVRVPTTVSWWWDDDLIFGRSRPGTAMEVTPCSTPAVLMG